MVCRMAVILMNGTVHGDNIALDEPLPVQEGCRVRIRIEPIEDPEFAIPPEENARLWRQWAATGPQGPIDRDDDWPNDL